MSISRVDLKKTEAAQLNTETTTVTQGEPLLFDAKNNSTKDKTAAQSADPEHPVVDAPKELKKDDDSAKQRAINIFKEGSDNFKKNVREIINDYVKTQYKNYSEEEIAAKTDEICNAEIQETQDLVKDIAALQILTKFEALKANKMSIEDYNRLSDEKKSEFIAQFGTKALMSICEGLIDKDQKENLNWKSLNDYQKLEKYADALLNKIDPKYAELNDEQKAAYVKGTIDKMVSPIMKSWKNLDENTKSELIHSLVETGKMLQQYGIDPKTYSTMTVKQRVDLLERYYKDNNIEYDRKDIAYNMVVQICLTSEETISPKKLIDYLKKHPELSCQKEMLKIANDFAQKGIKISTQSSLSQKASLSNKSTEQYVEDQVKIASECKTPEERNKIIAELMHSANKENAAKKVTYNALIKNTAIKYKIPWKEIQKYMQEEKNQNRLRAQILLDAQFGKSEEVKADMHINHDLGLNHIAEEGGSTYLTNSQDTKGSGEVAVVMTNYGFAETAASSINNNIYMSIDQKEQVYDYAYNSDQISEIAVKELSHYMVTTATDPEMQIHYLNTFKDCGNENVLEGLASAAQYVDESIRDEYTQTIQESINNSNFSDEVKAKLNKAVETGELSGTSQSQNGTKSSTQGVKTGGGVSGQIRSSATVSTTQATSTQSAQSQGVQQPTQTQAQISTEQARIAKQQAAMESYKQTVKITMELLDKISEYETEKAQKNQKRLEEKQQAAKKADEKAAIERKRRIAAAKQSDEQARVNEKTIEQASLEARIHAGLESGTRTSEDVIRERLTEAYETGGIEGFYDELFEVIGRNNALTIINGNSDYRRRFIQNCKNNVSLMKDLISLCATEDEKLEILRQIPSATALQLIGEISMSPSAMQSAVSNGTLTSTFAYDFLESKMNSSDFKDYFEALKRFLPLAEQNEFREDSRYTSTASSQGGRSNNRRAVDDVDYQNLRQYYGIV